jgi:hypothetical protein
MLEKISLGVAKVGNSRVFFFFFFLGGNFSNFPPKTSETIGLLEEALSI